MEAGVNHFAADVQVPMSIPRRVLAWWVAQIKHVLPPTIFFFVGFNLILWTKQLILKEHGIDFSGFVTATLAALLIGKAVLVTDNLPFMSRFDGAPLIQPILFKTAIYWVCVAVVRIGEALIRFLLSGGGINDFPDYLVALFLAAILIDSDLVDGAVSSLRNCARIERPLRLWRTLSIVLPLAVYRGQTDAPRAHSPSCPPQSAD
jgi:hypothetical protein